MATRPLQLRLAGSLYGISRSHALGTACLLRSTVRHRREMATPIAPLMVRHASTLIQDSVSADDTQLFSNPESSHKAAAPSFHMELANGILRNAFGYKSFRHEQEAAIETILKGNNAAIIFPTGAGKSICFQIPALAFPYLGEIPADGAYSQGITLVVSPLLALMKDQVDALKAKGVAAERLDSTLTGAETREILSKLPTGKYKLLYVAPERLNNELFLETIKKVKGGIRLLAVDEAHCISEWGHSFRPDYLKIARFGKEINAERVLCLTATARPVVADDICKAFDIQPQNVFRTRPYRPNLFLQAKSYKKKAQKWKPLKTFLDANEGPTIVYVTTQKQTEDLAAKLRKNGYSAAPYHAGMRPEEKKQVQEDFMANKIRMIVATIAFGMGIDKPDIRNIVHYDVPSTVEEYSQQVGRAGRDGKPSKCVVYLCPEDFYVREALARADLPSLTSIEGLLREVLIENANTPVGKSISASHYDQSLKYDIRGTALGNIYAILELRFGLLREITPQFSRFRFKPLDKGRRALQDDDSPAAQAILSSIKPGSLWGEIDMTEIVQQSGLPREDIVRRLNDLQDNSGLDVTVHNIQQHYRVLSPLPRTEAEITKLAKKMFDEMELRERAALDRAKEVTDMITADACIAHTMTQHFGTGLPQGGTRCGHCSFCTTGKAAAMPELPKPELDLEGIDKLLEAIPERDDPRFLTRIGFGIKSPRARALKYAYLPVFGSLAKQDFMALLSAFEKACNEAYDE